MPASKKKSRKATASPTRAPRQLAAKKQHKRSPMLEAERIALGRRLRTRRRELGISAIEVADGIVYTNHLYLIERGRYAPGVAILQQLAARLGVTLDWLLTGKRNGGGK